MNQKIDIEEFLPKYDEQKPEDSGTQYYNDDVKKILEVWHNECYSPELLNYQEELMQNLTEMLEAQTENVASLRNKDSEDQISIVLLEQEMERIKYVLQSYLRIRLSKIQKYTSFFLGSEVYRARMSAAEIRFAERYVDMSIHAWKDTARFLLTLRSFDALLKFNFNESFLNQFPAYMRNLEDTSETQIVRKPDLGKAVICRVKEEIGEVYISESESVMMKSGNIYILRYDTIRSVLEKGMIELI